MKVFGCVSYIRVNNVDIDNLNTKAKKWFFIGYMLDDLGYLFWNNHKKGYPRSLDVSFNENTLHKDDIVAHSAETRNPK